MSRDLKEKRGSRADRWGESDPGRGKSWSKGLGVGICLPFFKNSKEATVAGVK